MKRITPIIFALLFLLVVNSSFAPITLSRTEILAPGVFKLSRAIYAKEKIENITHTSELARGDVNFYFYSDAAGTIPLSVAGLSITYTSYRTTCSTGQMIGGSHTVTANGYSYGLSGVLLSQDDGIHCWTWEYLLVAGGGYTVI